MKNGCIRLNEIIQCIIFSTDYLWCSTFICPIICSLVICIESAQLSNQTFRKRSMFIVLWWFSRVAISANFYPFKSLPFFVIVLYFLICFFGYLCLVGIVSSATDKSNHSPLLTMNWFGLVEITITPLSSNWQCFSHFVSCKWLISVSMKLSP